MNTSIRDLRVVGFVEGVSFLVLLLVAMPLKYAFDMPMMVRVVGMIHGILFIAFVLAAIRVKFTHGWSWKWLMFALLMSVIPAGTFYLDAQLKRERHPERA